MDTENGKISEKKTDLSDKDFYEQACSYFYYHAGQRTTMINYFIAAFGAFLAVYGALITKPEYSVACALIAVFMGIVSWIFYLIDLRNKFDVKKSENVIRQFERDYGVDSPKRDYAYGVFSNETNIFKYYGDRKTMKQKKAYSELLKLHRKVTKCKADPELLEKKIRELVADDKTVSVCEIRESIEEKSVAHLSACIKWLYYLCIIISIAAFALAVFLTIKGFI